MDLSQDLISKFVEVTNQNKQESQGKNVYGTIVESEGETMVRLDGAELLTPISGVVDAKNGDRVLVSLANHSAVVLGNFTYKPSARDTIMAQATADDALAEARYAIVYADTVVAGYVKADELEVTVGNFGYLKANELTAEVAKLGYVTVTDLNAVTARIGTLESNQITTDQLNANYVKVDKANINKAWIEDLLVTGSFLVEDINAATGSFSKYLTGVRIVGDLIEANTLKADKLVLQGVDGLYYQLNVNSLGEAVVSASPTTYTNKLDGSVIVAESITADKINVTDLFAQDITATGTITGANLIGATGTFTGEITADRGHIGKFDIVEGRLNVTVNMTTLESAPTYISMMENILACEGDESGEAPGTFMGRRTLWISPAHVGAYYLTADGRYERWTSLSADGITMYTLDHETGSTNTPSVYGDNYCSVAGEICGERIASFGDIDVSGTLYALTDFQCEGTAIIHGATIINGATDVYSLYSTNKIVTGTSVYTNGKTAVDDGQTGCVLSNTGRLHLINTSADPYINFYNDDTTSAGARIGYDTSKDYMVFNLATRYTFSNRVSVVGDVMCDYGVYTGGKTASTDGKPGAVVGAAGRLYLTGTDDIPGIYFYHNQTSYGSKIAYDSSTDYMNFASAVRYEFDNRVDVDGILTTSSNLYVGNGSGYTSDCCIYMPYADGSNHAVIIRSTDGLTTHFGWGGSSTYQTISILRGRTVKYSNSSGTTTLSDERLKRDFTCLDEWDSFFDIIEPCAFKMKGGDSDRFHFGFKAQQIEQALFECGKSTKDFAGFVRMKYQPDTEDPEGNAVYAAAGITPGDYEYGLIYSEFTALNTDQIQKLKHRVAQMDNDYRMMNESLIYQIHQLFDIVAKQQKIIDSFMAA